MPKSKGGNSKNVHTVRHGTGWANKREGSKRVSSTHHTQAAAWKVGKRAAKKSKGEAYLHGQDGRIRERNTYGNDPHPPKG
jgi:hypothetical protein